MVYVCYFIRIFSLSIKEQIWTTGSRHFLSVSEQYFGASRLTDNESLVYWNGLMY